MTRLLPILILLLAAPAFAGGDLFAVTTTYEIFGGTAQMSIDAPYPKILDAYQVHSDAIVRNYARRWVFIVNRLGADNVLVLDRNAGFGVVAQYAVSGTGLNPRDIYVAAADGPGSGPGRAFITLYETNSLLVCDALTGANASTIDLSTFADTDGLCEMDQMVMVPSLPGHPEGLLFVSIQRQDRSGSWWVAGDAELALVDIATESLVDANPGTPGIDGVPLQLRNPFWRMQYLPVGDRGWRVLVNCPGSYGVDDGGVEMVDPVTLQSDGVLISDAQLGGDALDFALHGLYTGWALRSNPSFQTGLVRFDVGTGQVVQTAHTSTGFDLADMEMSLDGRLFVGDRDASNPGIRIFDPDDGTLLAGPIDTGLPPFDMTLLDDIPVSAPPRLAASKLVAFPNPFNPRVEIRLDPVREGPTLEIVDLRGRIVARLGTSSDSRWLWDGTNERGEAVASGTYFARATGVDVQAIKLTLVR